MNNDRLSWRLAPQALDQIRALRRRLQTTRRQSSRQGRVDQLASPPPLAVADLAQIDQLVADVGIPDWDVLIIGDGSGQTWEHRCGWAGILLDRASRRRKLLYGGMNHGSVAIAEFMAYLHAMLWYQAYRDKQRLPPRGRRRPLKVHIISDNQPLVLQGQSLRRDAGQLAHLRTNWLLWRALWALEEAGYEFHFTWRPRNYVALNILADIVAGRASRALQTVELPWRTDETGNKRPLSIYEVTFAEHEYFRRKRPERGPSAGLPG